MSLICEPHIEIRSVFGGYIVSCLEFGSTNDEQGVGDYCCATIEDVCNLVRFTLEGVDRIDVDDVEKALKEKAKKTK